MVLTMSTEDLSCSTKSIKNSFLVSRFSFLVLGTRQFWRGSRSYVDTISTAVAHERETRNQKRFFIFSKPPRATSPAVALLSDPDRRPSDRKSTRLNSSHLGISYA